MTIMLDDQARLATGAIHDSVAAYEPAAPMPVLVRRAAVRQGVQWTMGAIAAAAFVAMVAFVFAPSPHTDVTDTTTPVTVTSLPPTTIPATTVPDEPVLRVDPPPVPAASPSTTTTSTILVTVEGHHDDAPRDVAAALEDLRSLLTEYAAPASMQSTILSAETDSFG